MKNRMSGEEIGWQKKCFSWLQKNENIHYVVRSAFLLFVAVYVSVEWGDKWQPIWNEYIVIPYLQIKTSWGLVFMGLCTIVTMLWCVYICTHKTRISWRRNMPFIGVVLFLYVYFRFFSDSYVFLPQEWSFKFFDWGVVLLSLLMIEFVIVDIICQNKSKKEKECDFLYDGAIEFKEQDLLDYFSKALVAADALKRFDVSEHSWSIGVTGKWGEGKTSYINLILENLSSDEYDIIRFNPRSSKNVSTIQEDALNLLAERLKIYYVGLSSLFRNYICALGLIDSTGWIEKAFSLYGLVDVENRREKLNEALKFIPKKVVFVIDDFDRLTKDEIVEVLKLLDRNADFPNIIYITAYDKSYVGKQFAGDVISSNPCSFVDKFFNVEWNIPIRNYTNVYGYIISRIKEIVDTSQFGYDISEINRKGFYQNIIKKHVPTMRDAKRLVNLFQSDYQLVRGEVDVVDFLLVTMIKYRYMDEYTALFNLDYLVDNANKTYGFDKTKIEKLRSKDIIEHLFVSGGNTGRPRRIFQRESFNNYFTDHIGNKLNLPQLALLFSEDISKVEELIKEWSADIIMATEVADYIDSRRQQIHSVANVFKYVDVVLLYNGYVDSSISLLYAKQIVNINEFYSEHYRMRENEELTKEALYDRINRYFGKKILLPGDISILKDMYLSEEEQQNQLLILGKDEIQAIITGHFADYTSQIKTFDKYCMNFLYACIDHVGKTDNHVYLNSSCCDIARKLIEKYPDYYIEQFVRLQYVSSDPSSNSITGEPFWKQIFGKPEEFKKMISEDKLNSLKNIKRVRNFWEIYSANNYQPIEFYGQGAVQKIIDNDLNIQVNQLKQLQKYHVQFTDLLKTSASMIQVVIDKYKLQLIMDNVEKINLQIALKTKMLSEMKRILARM